METNLTAEELASARALNGKPPWGSPGKYPPGPERELVEQKHQLWLRERIKSSDEARHQRSALPPEVLARRSMWENATRVEKQIPGSPVKPLPYVKDEDIPPAELALHHRNLLRYLKHEEERIATAGPSKALIAIMGQRPEKDLHEIVRVVSETEWEFRPNPRIQAAGLGTPEHRVAYIRRELAAMKIDITDEQIRKLIASKPVHRLWVKD